MKEVGTKGALLESHRAEVLQVKTRLSDYSFKNFQNIPSRKQLKTSIKQGLIFLDGQQGYTGDLLMGGELIEVYSSLEEKKTVLLEMPIEVIYEDNELALVNKPAGLEVSGNKHRTLEHSLSFNLEPSISSDALLHAQAIHRLDYPTSGLVLIGKTRSSVVALNRSFEERAVKKEYLAVVHGTCETTFESELDVEGKKSKTSFELLASVPSEKYAAFSLVKCFPVTGRRHQLRIHLAKLGHPILGDKLYGVEGEILFGKGLYLHAYALGFVHPKTLEEMQFSVDPPNKFKKLFPEIM